MACERSARWIGQPICGRLVLLVLAHPTPIGEAASDVDALDRPLEALARLPVPAGDRQASGQPRAGSYRRGLHASTVV
jgi:hypothetical protein